MKNSVFTRLGGVLIATNKSLNCTEVSLPDHTDIEICCSKVMLESSAVFIVCLYIPPASNLVTVSRYLDAILFIDSLMSKPSDTFLIFGDFNLPGIRWDPADTDTTYMFPAKASTEVEIEFVDCLLSLGLFQMNSVRNHQGRLLDLIFTNTTDDKLVMASGDILTSIDLYHPALELCYNNICDTNFNLNTFYKFDFKNADYNSILVALDSYDCSIFMNSGDLEALCDEFYRVISEVVYKYVPVVKVMGMNNGCPWINPEIISLKRDKNRAYRKWRLSGATSDLHYYKRIKSRLKSSLSVSYFRYIRDTQSNIKSNPGKFWSYIRSRNNNDGFPSCLEFNNFESEKPQIIADMFASFFENVYVKNDSQCDCRNFDYIVDSNSALFHDICFSEAEVLDFLKTVDLNFSSGPDGVPSGFLRLCAEPLHRLICKIYDMSLSLGSFPSVWKFSYIFPIFKAGLKKKIVNYRGICKQSAVAKIFDALVTSRLQFYCKNLISPNQHGFMRSRSTVTNLLSLTDFVCTAFEDSSQVDAVYTDFSKAFDRVDHILLLLKIKKFGFPVLFVNWLSSFLSCRSQCVIFRNNLSRPISVPSGVPQGSHIGPLLFILFINDIVDFAPKCNILMFADDLKIFSKVSDLNQVRSLQLAVSALGNWSELNRLPLNLEKCFIISFSHRRLPIFGNYSLLGSVLERKFVIKDLGIMLDVKLNFNEHIDHMIKKANKAWGLVRRYCSDFTDPYVTKTLYVAYVRSILDTALLFGLLFIPSTSIVLRPFKRSFFGLRLEG